MLKFLKSKSTKVAVGLLAVVMMVGVFAQTASASIVHTLKKGTTYHTEVMELQSGLNTMGFANPALVADGAFGAKTDAAVKAFQTNKGLVADGIFGAKSRAAWTGTGPTQALCPNGMTLASNCTMPPSTGPVVVGPLSASLATTNPASSYLATGTAANPILAFTVSNGTNASVSITGINLTKTGYYPNTDVSGVSVFDGSGVRHGNVVTTLGANGIANMTFGSDPIMVGANQSMTIMVKVDIAAGTDTGTLGFKINSASDIMVTGGTMTIASPIMSNQMSILNGSSSIGAVTVDELPLNVSGVSLNADANSAQDISKFRVQSTNSNEDLALHGLTLWNNGNAAGTDYKDVQLVDQTGTVLATAQPMGQNVTFALTTPYMITKGQTKDFWIKAKLINGASRTIQFVVYNNYDLDIRGVSTGAGLLASAGSNDTSFPIGDSTSTYNKVTIASGSLVFSRATDSPSSAVTPGANDVVLAKYIAKPIGENMELRGVTFGLDQDTGSVALTGTVYVKVNGSVVYSAAANTTNFALAGTAVARTLSSYPILTAGVDNTIEITGSISSSATASDAYFVNDFDITSVKRLITNDITDPAVSTQDGFTRNVQSGALVTTTLSTPVATSVVAGTNDVPLANFEFNASASGEDVRISSVTVTDTLGSGSDYSGIQNLVMKDATGNVLTTSSSTATNANTVTFNFTNAIIVSRTATTVIKLYGNVVSSTGTSHTYKIASGGVTATGKDTGNTITSSVAGSGQAMTTSATTGLLTLSTLSGTGATPSTAQLVTINQDGTYLAGRLTAQYEAQKITSLTVKAIGTALTQNNISDIRVYAQTGTGTTLTAINPFATASQFDSCSSNTCTYTWTAADNLLKDGSGVGLTVNPGTPVTIFVKAKIQGENVAKLGNDFYFSVAQTAQVNTVTPVAANSTVYTHTINGVAVTYTSDGSATVAEITAGMTAAINASSQAPYVTAADGTTVYTVTSDVEGLGFTSSTSGSAGTLADVATTANGGVASKGATSNTYLPSANTTGSAVNTAGISYIAPFGVAIEGYTPTSGSTDTRNVAAGTQLGRFKITNNGSAQITFGGASTTFTITDNGTHTATDVTYSLYASDENSSNVGTLVDNDGTDNAAAITFGTLDTTFTLNGGAYRYVTVMLLAGTVTTDGDSWNLGVNAVGDVTYSATEANLGYDGEQDGDITGTIAGLKTSGTPLLGSVVDAN